MSMDAGDNTVQVGTMAKAIYDELTSEFGAAGSTDLDEQRKKMAAAIAAAVVNHIKDNADVTITTSDGKLQQVSSADTDPPSAERTLAKAVD